MKKSTLQAVTLPFHTLSPIPTREEFHRRDSGIICKTDFETEFPCYMAQSAGRIAGSFKRDSVSQIQLLTSNIM